MPSQLIIPAIQEQLFRACDKLVGHCNSLTDKQFFFQHEGKWPAARQVRHLVKATTTSNPAFILPKWIVRIVGGKPSRDHEPVMNWSPNTN